MPIDKIYVRASCHKRSKEVLKDGKSYEEAYFRCGIPYNEMGPEIRENFSCILFAN